MLERRHIEVRSADQIAAELRSAFDTFCTKGVENQPQSASKPEVPDLQNSTTLGPHVLKIQTRPS
jgi:hypothetical protein